MKDLPFIGKGMSNEHKPHDFFSPALCELRHMEVSRSIDRLEECLMLLSKTVQTTHDTVLLMQQTIASQVKIQEVHSTEISTLKDSATKMRGGWWMLTTCTSILVGFAGLAATIYKVFK